MSNGPDKRPALILFSHGSLLCGAGAALDRQAQRLHATGNFLTVATGYLNYSQPSIEEAIDHCVQAGASSIVVVPFFLVAGKFVREDLPERLQKIRDTAMDDPVPVIVARAIEDAPGMLALIQELRRHGTDPQSWQTAAVQRALANCENRPDCPLYGSELCRAASIGKESRIPTANETAPHHPAESFSRSGLLLVLHGSPRPAANRPAEEIARQLAESPSNAAIPGTGESSTPYVRIGYLECNEPSLAQALQQAAQDGITHLEVVPYFLHSGRHLVLDIPAALAESRRRHPQMQLLLTPPVGESDGLSEVLQMRAREAMKTP